MKGYEPQELTNTENLGQKLIGYGILRPLVCNSAWLGILEISRNLYSQLLSRTLCKSLLPVLRPWEVIHMSGWRPINSIKIYLLMANTYQVRERQFPWTSNRWGSSCLPILDEHLINKPKRFRFISIVIPLLTCHVLMRALIFTCDAEPSHKHTVITYAAISPHSPPRCQSTAHLDLKLFSC